MRAKSILTAAVITLLGGQAALAQDPIDIFRISQNSYSFSTARSAAMGGAFTSLGADGASSSINPAGIGMYRTTDIGITGSVLKNSINSSTIGNNGPYSTSAQTINGALNNLTAMFNINSAKGDVLRGVTLGYTYNSLNNLDSKQYTSSNYQSKSLLDVLAGDLGNINNQSITSSKDDPLQVYRNQSTGLWGGMLAYNTGLLFYSPDTDRYTLGSTLGVGDETYTDLNITTIGDKAESNFSVGFNILDRVYIGTTLGYQSYNYSSSRSHLEFANLDSNSGDLDNFEYIETLNIAGEGFSFKIGATIEVFDGFNVAIAYHAPTLYNIREEYFADMYSQFTTLTDNSFDAYTPYNVGSYEVSTAPTLLVGASYIIGKRAIISFDYDRVYYDKMKIRSGEFGSSVTNDINNNITSSYKSANNFRVGAEVRVGGNGYLRAGYAHYGNAEKDIEDIYNSSSNISAGIGLKFNLFYADFTYVNMRSKTPSSHFFYADYGDNYTLRSDDTFTTESIRNDFIFTMGVKF